ncbi:MAG TPA: hypothetical protein VHZ73_01990 [Vicinamibacterales bacterium]|jgi:hypothetical protein|nr:hypothetical protein [Vicinamibacterales bacterium]
MREFVKSAVTLPWAISMFGVQQVTNLIGPPSTKSIAGTTQALDAVSDASVKGLDGWAKQTYKIGAGVQRTLVDLMMLRAPEFDQSMLMHMAAEMQDGPVFNAMVKYGLPPVGWLDSMLVNRRDAPACAQEFSNKLQIIMLVTHVHAELGLDANTVDSLYTLVDKIGAMPTFPRIWATEGLGNWYGDVAVKKAEGGPDPTALLTDPQYDAIAPWTMTMLHAGIGMSFAKAILVTIDPSSPQEKLRAALARFVKLCRDSSRKGYAGAALESLGLATRTLYPNLLRVLDAEIPHVDPELHGYYWHGAGRAMYFEPMGMLPSVNAPWRVIRRLDIEAPHDLARRNILAGVGWALSIVNMRQPTVMEAFLRHHADQMLAEDAFTNGVVSSMAMRYDTSPDDPYISPYLHYEPVDAEVAPAWQTLITEPCERTLSKDYGELVRTHSLEQVFHYRPGSR